MSSYSPHILAQLFVSLEIPQLAFSYRAQYEGKNESHVEKNILGCSLTTILYAKVEK